MGILISNRGTVTLPCALIILGIPMLSIGKNYCNYSTSSTRTANRSSLNPNNNFSCPLFWSFLGANDVTVPFQWTVGLVFCYLAILCILIESGAFSILQKFNLKSNQGTILNTNTAEKNEADVETELMASHYHHDEILNLVKENVTLASQGLYMQSQNHATATATDDDDSNGEDANGGNGTKSGTEKGMDSAISRGKYQNLESKGIVHLNALALKVSKSESIPRNNKNADTINGKDSNQLILICQESAYKSLTAFPRSDRIQSAAISLLALIAKNEAVRERNLYEADEYGLNIPIRAMRGALRRVKDVDAGVGDMGTSNGNADVDGEEIIAAELQRKACLYLGALTDSSNQDKDVNGIESENHHQNVATKIVEEDGLIAILDAIDWFRFHDEVVNWGLWAVFMLCYNHVGNKIQFVRMDGIARVCRAIKTVVDDYQDQRDGNDDGKEDGPVASYSESSVKEVARHGVAILFDVLRYDEKSNASLDFTQLRRLSLNAGMHDVVTNVMHAFRDNSEIMMMGQQMLIATGYTGDIPHFEGSIVPMKKQR